MILDRQPVLDSAVLHIRPLRTDDFGALFAVASDPLIWALHPVSTRYQPDVFRAFFADSIASGGAMVVSLKATDQIIGSSRYFQPDPASGRAEIGWSFLARQYWGGAMNAQVKHLLLTHAFRFVDTVYFRVGESNIRSRRAMEKIGGRLTDLRDVIIGPTGAALPHVIFDLTRADFQSFAAKSPTTPPITLP